MSLPWYHTHLTFLLSPNYRTSRTTWISYCLTNRCFGSLVGTGLFLMYIPRSECVFVWLWQKNISWKARLFLRFLIFQCRFKRLARHVNLAFQTKSFPVFCSLTKEGCTREKRHKALGPSMKRQCFGLGGCFCSCGVVRNKCQDVWWRLMISIFNNGSAFLCDQQREKGQDNRLGSLLSFI